MLQPNPCGMTDSPDISRPSSEVAPPSSPPARAKESPPAPPSPRPRRLQGWWTLVVRLLILGTSISVGWIAGLLVAQVWPSGSPNPPLQERAMRQTSQTLRKVRQLPQWWQGSEAAMDSSVPPASEATAPLSEDTGSSEASTPTASPLNQEVTALQQDLVNLENRLAELEQQAGQPGTGTLEDRLQQLAEAAASDAAPETDIPTATDPPTDSEGNPSEGNPEPTPDTDTAPDTGPDAPNEPTNDGLGRHAVAPFSEPPFPLVSERIGLPSALLFAPESSLLTPTGKQLLDAIVPDLRRFGSVTLLVGSHTDGDLSAEDARQLTFQQALAVETYLAAQLENTNGRWLAVGYGKTRPLAVGDDPGTEVRNQRLEIGIVRP